MTSFKVYLGVGSEIFHFYRNGIQVITSMIYKKLIIIWNKHNYIYCRNNLKCPLNHLNGKIRRKIEFFQKFKFFEIQKFLEYIFSIHQKSKIETVLKWLILTSPLVHSRRQRHMARGPVCFGKKIEFPEVSLQYTGNFMSKIPTK